MSFQKWFNAPIDKETEAIILSTSYSLRRLYDTKLPRYLKCFVKVTNPSETMILFVSLDSSYALYPCYLFCFSLFLAGTLFWEEAMLTTGEGRHGNLKKPGGGKNMHSVLEGLSL